MNVLRWLPMAVIVVLGTVGRVSAEPPEQFRVWGTAGPETPTLPEGWTEIRDTAEALPPLIPTPEEQRRSYIVFARDPKWRRSRQTRPARPRSV